MINDEADEFIKELFKSLKKRYQNNLEKMEGSEPVCDDVHLLCYKCHKINLNCGGSYRYSSDWIKIKKPTINPINEKDNKYFQYAVTVALNLEELRKDPQIITKIKPFLNKCNWEGINFPSEKYDWEKFEKNNQRLLLMLCMLKMKKYFLAMFQNIIQIVKNKLFF